MTQTLNRLFEPAKWGKLESRNRIKYGACCVSNYSERDGTITVRELGRMQVIGGPQCGILTNQDAYPDRGWIKTAADYAEVHNSPACDGTTFHEYESKIPYRVYGVASRFAGFKTALNAIGKILIVGEYGVGDGDTQTTTAAVRVDRARIKSVAYRNAGAVSLYWAVAEPWSTAEPTKGDGAWERVDSPVVAAIATV